ncbi:MAG: metallophosphoesterase [Candidatus Heimdallarchaeota archaeon]
MPNTVIIGDVHLGADGYLEEEFKEALESVAEDVDLILFNGDFLDSYEEKGKKVFDNFIEWLETKGWKEKIVFITGGMGHEGNILFDYPSIQILPWAILNTKEGRIIVCHGHNIGLVKRSDETWVQAANNLKKRLVKNAIDFLPKILPTDKLIISHAHVPFYDMENGVFATGSWVLKDELRENVDFIKRNIGVFILVDDEDRNDPIKMKRFFELQTLKA